MLRGQAALVAWAQKTTYGYSGVNVQNLSESWRDGLAFAALVHSYAPPGSYDWEEMLQLTPLERMKKAFAVATAMGVPPLMDAEDVLAGSRPDLFAISTYLTSMYKVFRPLPLTGSSDNLRARARTEPGTSLTKVPVNSTGPTCAGCNDMIGGTAITWMNKDFHMSCFRCAGCQRELANLGGCLNVDDSPYCEQCGRQAWINATRPGQPRPKPALNRTVSEARGLAAHATHVSGSPLGSSSGLNRVRPRSEEPLWKKKQREKEQMMKEQEAEKARLKEEKVKQEMERLKREKEERLLQKEAKEKENTEIDTLQDEKERKEREVREEKEKEERAKEREREEKAKEKEREEKEREETEREKRERGREARKREREEREKAEREETEKQAAAKSTKQEGESEDAQLLIDALLQRIEEKKKKIEELKRKEEEATKILEEKRANREERRNEEPETAEQREKEREQKRKERESKQQEEELAFQKRREARRKRLEELLLPVATGDDENKDAPMSPTTAELRRRKQQREQEKLEEEEKVLHDRKERERRREERQKQLDLEIQRQDEERKRNRAERRKRLGLLNS